MGGELYLKVKFPPIGWKELQLSSDTFMMGTQQWNTGSPLIPTGEFRHQDSRRWGPQKGPNGSPNNKGTYAHSSW